MHPALCERLVRQQMEEALNEDGLFSNRVVLVENGFPNIYIIFVNKHDATRLLRFNCENYDFQPISVEPIDPVTQVSLPRAGWMRRNGGDFPEHPILKRPFLCLDGTRDYYSYPGHTPNLTGNRWERWREQLRIADLIRVIRDRFQRGEWE